jgi:hypothetical protein
MSRNICTLRGSNAILLDRVADIRQGRELIELLLGTAESEQFLMKRELLTELRRRYGKILTYGWVQGVH